MRGGGVAHIAPWAAVLGSLAACSYLVSRCISGPMSVTQANTQSVPVLWQLEISHYNEKVRWALDHKRVRHIRGKWVAEIYRRHRLPPPRSSMTVATAAASDG